MKNKIAALLCACALVAPLAACGATGTTAASTTTSSDSAATTTSDKKDAEFDAVDHFYGQWRGSVKSTGQTVYGNVGGTEQMLDVFLNEDGSCEVKPLEAHADLLTDKGTWEAADASAVTLHLDTAGDITLTSVDDTTLEADPTAFDIDGFDTITFVLY